MGAIRKALFVATVGAVAPRSKKQKVALQTLSAIQGKSEATVRRTGTRRQAIYGYTTERNDSWDEAEIHRGGACVLPCAFSRKVVRSIPVELDTAFAVMLHWGLQMKHSVSRKDT